MTVPTSFYGKPDGEGLRKEYIGKNINELPTPSFIINRDVVEKNCKEMIEGAKRLKAKFRPHVKTHKCSEITQMQLGDYSGRIVVSTLREAWSLIDLYNNGKIHDVLYGIPIVKSKLKELQELKEHVETVRILVDNIDQLALIKDFVEMDGNDIWSIVIKVDMGTSRAGVGFQSEELKQLITACISKYSNFVSLDGFYCHAGHSYSSHSSLEAQNYLYEELSAGSIAVTYAKEIQPSGKYFVSVGSTPTAHATSEASLSVLDHLTKNIDELELHAGNYSLCDLQQLATGCITKDSIACRVLTEVVSTYPERGDIPPGEVLINAGVIALAREPGQLPGFGLVSTPEHQHWYVGRLSQEHGILVPSPTTSSSPIFPPLGTKLLIIPQHACIASNSFSWYFITDSSSTVIDVWIPFRGW